MGTGHRGHVTNVWGETQKTVLGLYFTSEKSKMAAAAILKIGLMAISRSLWHIFERNFTQGLKTILSKLFCRQNSISTKSKMAAAAILKIDLKTRTIWLILYLHQILQTD